MMASAATVFVVTDIAKSTEHDVLGFTNAELRHSMCACVGTKLPCTSASQTSRLSRNGGIACSRDVDAVYAELAARGTRIVKPPQNYDYGMRDVDLIDLKRTCGQHPLKVRVRWAAVD
jgi:uncharacterized glyoxalase superfamily protein PhnB